VTRRRARTRARYNQPPLKGGRDPLFSCVLPEIRQAAIEVAREYDVSPSWVVASILAKALGISSQVSYQTAAQLAARAAKERAEKRNGKG